jgi:hypothetical protein
LASCRGEETFDPEAMAGTDIAIATPDRIAATTKRPITRSA